MSRRIARAVATAAAADGAGDDIDAAEIDRRLAASWWEPSYRELAPTVEASRP